MGPKYLRQKGKADFSLKIVAHFRTGQTDAM